MATPAQPPTRDLPAPAEIVEREAPRRRIAAIAAGISALFILIALVLDQVMVSAGVPSPQDHAVDLVEALAAQQGGEPFPTSFWTEYAKFKLDHQALTIAVGVLRGLAIILWVPATILLLQAARDRGGQVHRVLSPLAQIGLVAVGLTFAAAAIAETLAFRAAEQHDLLPAAVLDKLGNDTVAILSNGIGLFSLIVAVPLALGGLQAMRVGLLPRMFGFMGVLVGILFVLPFDPSFLLRGFWFGAIALIISGKLRGGMPAAWAQGVAVEPEPRQPPQLREPAQKSKKAKAASSKAPKNGASSSEQ